MTDPVGQGVERRGVLATLALGGLAMTASAVAAGTGPATATADLAMAFEQAWSTPPGSTSVPVERRLAFLADTAVIIDDDTPFVLDRPAYADHLAFHAGSWERFEWLPHGLAAAVHGDTGIVSTNYIERGKPKGAGFRLRAGYCTAVCVRQGDGWRAISVHMAPLSGQLIDASPG